jgi:replicative DNA helicase
MNESTILEEKILREQLLKNYQGPDRVVHATELAERYAEERKNRPPFSATTGLPTIDACLDGFRKGQLVVVSGPPKNGKTLLCQTFTTRFTEQNHKCLWLEYELSGEEFLMKFPDGKLDFHLPNEMHSKSLDWIEERIIESQEKFGTEMVFIDHLDFLRDDKKLRNDVSINLSSYIGGIVQKVKSIAVQRNIIIFLMSHLRKNEWTSGKLPSSEELRDSGQIAQLADTVMMIMRKRDKANGNLYLENDAIVGVIENRHTGRTGFVDVQMKDGEFHESTSQFLNQPIPQKEDQWLN